MSVPIAGQTYVVRAGDSLWKIASKAYGDGARWPLISEANKLKNPRLLYAGIKLKLPPISVAAKTTPAKPSPTSAPVGGTPKTEMDFLGAVYSAYPPASYTLEKTFKKVELPLPNMKVTYSFKGTVAFELGKPIDLATIDLGKKELSSTAKAEYDSDIIKAIGDVGWTWSSVTNKVELSMGLTTHSKVGGKTIVCSQTKIIPPNKVLYTSQPQPIEGKIGNLAYKGNISAELEIEVTPPRLQPVPIPVAQRFPVLAMQSPKIDLLPAVGKFSVGIACYVGVAVYIATGPVSVPLTGAVVAGVALISFLTVQKDHGASPPST